MSARALKIIELGRIQLGIGIGPEPPLDVVPSSATVQGMSGHNPALTCKQSTSRQTEIFEVRNEEVSLPSGSGMPKPRPERLTSKAHYHEISCDPAEDDYDSDDSTRDNDWIPVPDSAAQDYSSADDEDRPRVVLESEDEIEGSNNIALAPIVPAEQEMTVPRAKKRSRDPSKWERNKKKAALNSGKAYTNAAGKAIAEKVLKRPCGNKCRLKCTTKIDKDQRQLILKSFWAMGDIARQRDFVTKYVTTKTPAYRNPKEGSNRSCNNEYSFELDKQRIIVCKTFFQSTINVGNTMIDTSIKKKDAQGVVGSELRGKHGLQKKIDPEVKAFIREHINSFPRVESHYCRANTVREYLEGSLNLATMYRLYIERCRELGVPIAKSHHYASVFNTEFNISFFIPKKDQCGICVGFDNAVGEDKEKKKAHFDNHLKEKVLAREEKTKDVQYAAEHDDAVVSCFDLQAVLQTPCGDVSALYYKRRLATYNFTIFDLNSKDGFCYIWHEGIANRGANEIGSCVRKYLTKECLGKNVIFFTDNCVGQNKNKFLVAMYVHTVMTEDILSITHKFLQVGHTQNEGDNMHSVIEREKKRMLRSGPIYVPSQWVSVIRLAKKNGNPYHVMELDTEDICDLKCLTKELGKNFTLNDYGEKVVWADIRILHVEKCSPFIVFYKTFYTDVTYKTINIRLKMRGRQLIVSNIAVIKAYQEPPKISAQKKADLLSLCKDSLIPRVYHDFYNGLKVAGCVVTDRNENDDDNSEDEWEN